MNYVIHYCKDPKCNNAFIDTDVTKAKTRPPQWRYCPECCEKFGYVNPDKPPISKKKQEQLQKARSMIEKKTQNKELIKK